jgi:Skp family chaperone for outer membrane proteins
VRRALAVLLVAALLAPAARAQDARQDAPGAFLVLDTGRLAAEAAAMRSIAAQAAQRRDVEAAAYNMALDKLETEFEPARAAAATMEPAERQKAQEAFAKAKAHADGVLERTEAEMNAAIEKAVARFNAVSDAVGKEVLRERGAARFVDRGVVLYIRAGSPYDATDEVIRRINERLPDVKVEFPAPAKP